MASTDQESSGVLAHGCPRLKALLDRLCGGLVRIARKTKKLGKEDPRRIIHSVKVGLALTLVSVFYYFKPLYDGFGVNAIWAVLTVVVVFEYSVGGTLGKGLNRIVATLVAGALGVGAHRLATLSGDTGEPILIAIFVFLVAAIATFTRFFPELKARYDYGLNIFILTFSLVSVSGYRDHQVIEMAHMRLSTILIGSSTAVLVCIGICPVWIGEDLHNLVADNTEKLGSFLEGFGSEYLKLSEDGPSSSDESFLQKYGSVLSSKASEETMANLARWEPGHGRFRFFHPWQQYLKIGALTRECAYKIQALDDYLSSEIQIPKEIRNRYQDSCTKISVECGKALKELASATRRMELSRLAAEPHIRRSKDAAENVKSLLGMQLWEGAILIDVVPVATVASLLWQVVEKTEKIAEAVYELASMAHFKNSDATALQKQSHLVHMETMQPMPSMI